MVTASRHQCVRHDLTEHTHAHAHATMASVYQHEEFEMLEEDDLQSSSSSSSSSSQGHPQGAPPPLGSPSKNKQTYLSSLRKAFSKTSQRGGTDPDPPTTPTRQSSISSPVKMDAFTHLFSAALSFSKSCDEGRRGRARRTMTNHPLASVYNTAASWGNVFTRHTTSSKGESSRKSSKREADMGEFKGESSSCRRSARRSSSSRKSSRRSSSSSSSSSSVHPPVLDDVFNFNSLLGNIFGARPKKQ